MFEIVTVVGTISTTSVFVARTPDVSVARPWNPPPDAAPFQKFVSTWSAIVSPK